MVFTETILKLAEDICEGKLVFALEGGYSLIALPYCIHAVIRALLKEEYEQPDFEKNFISSEDKYEEIQKMKPALLKLLKKHWKL